MGNDADGFVADLFAQLKERASNGFALTEDDWALLALVDESCASRVQRLIAMYPEEFRDRVAALIAWYRSEEPPSPEGHARTSG
jgi:hypothetical protein